MIQTMHGGGPVPPPSVTDAPRREEGMRQIHGYLSRRAQNLDPRALVYEEEDGRFVLERPDQPALLLGQDHGEARQSIDAMVRAHRVQNG